MNGLVPAPEAGDRNQKRWMTSLVIFLAWTGYALLESMLNIYHERMTWSRSIAENLLTFYLCALLMVPVWRLISGPVSKWAWPWQVLLHIPVAAGYIGAWFAFYYLLYPWILGEDLDHLKYYWLYLLEDTLRVYIACGALCYVLAFSQRLDERRRAQSRAELLAKDMQLELLKSRVNPHFLFNALHTVNALIKGSPEKARAVLADLADCLRYALESDEHERTPLRRELTFVDAYLSIAKARWGSRIAVKRDVDDDAWSCLVPPMTVQPLVENVVQHVVGKQEPDVRLNLTVRLERDRLRISVIDNGLARVSLDVDQLLSAGRGLGDTDQRLRLIYGQESGLQFGPSDGPGFEVSFGIPAEMER